MIDPKQIEEWKREGPGLVSDPISTWTEVIGPLLAEREELLALLREVEWHGWSESYDTEQGAIYGPGGCPACHGSASHETDCRLAAALRGTP